MKRGLFGLHAGADGAGVETGGAPNLGAQIAMLPIGFRKRALPLAVL